MSKIWPYETGGCQKSTTMTDLNQTTVVPSDEQLSIITNEAASRDILESRDCLCNFLCPRGVYMHSGSCGDRISMWFGEREVNRSDGSIFLDKDWAFERPPITRFYAMLFWSRFCMFTWDDRPVIHTATRARADPLSTHFPTSRVDQHFIDFSRPALLFFFLCPLQSLQNVVVSRPHYRG
jgi:hypothetical protein